MTEPAALLVRAAVPEDAEALQDLHHACWREAYTGLVPDAVIDAAMADRAAGIARRREQLASGDRVTLLAVRVGRLVGFAAAGAPRDDDPPTDLELYALYTRAAEWGRGTGRRLLREAVGLVPAHLWVLEGNERARRFYRREGFTPDGATGTHPGGPELRLVRSGSLAPSNA